jgi:RNA-binding protein
MPAPTSPKKKSLMPSSKLRSALRGHGHKLAAVVQIGKSGATPAVVKQLAQALYHHELVKVRLGSECPESRFEVAERLADQPGVQVAQILGRTILLYKRHPQEPRFEGARAKRNDASPTESAAAGPARDRASRRSSLPHNLTLSARQGGQSKEAGARRRVQRQGRARR